jgi:hypothetical protein
VQQPVSAPDRGAVCKALVSPAVPSLLVIAVVALLLSACAGTGDITARVAPTAQPGSSTDSDDPGGAMAAPNSSGPSNVAVSPRQRGYLDALAAAGVRPSTDLMALSIGSYVCQGRAAGQSDQAVWDFVFPLVRNDVIDAQDGAGADTPRPAMSAQDSTVQYIRIATERLC